MIQNINKKGAVTAFTTTDNAFFRKLEQIIKIHLARIIPSSIKNTTPRCFLNQGNMGGCHE